MKVAELTGVLLDYWVARADGRTAKILQPGEKINSMPVRGTMCATLTPGYSDWWQPFHVYWGSMGEIIERERIAIEPGGDGWQATKGLLSDHRDTRFNGPTPTIAAARAFVAAKLGAEVPDVK